MKDTQMSFEAAGAVSLKSGFLSAAFLVFVALVSTVLGFAVVPPAKGSEHVDAARRVGAGILCAFILGLPLTIAYSRFDPSYLPFFVSLVGGGDDAHRLTAYVLAATPFFALCAIIGFWVVAAAMQFFINRKGKDLLQIAEELKNEVHP